MQSGAPGDSAAGWGVARWSNGALAEGARGRLEVGTTSNMAKYHGLAEAFAKAFERSSLDRAVVFELDTNFIVRQVLQYGKGKYACRSPLLIPLCLRCAALGSQLEEAGVSWEVRHVFSEYNLVADALAREGALYGNRGWALLRQV